MYCYLGEGSITKPHEYKDNNHENVLHTHTIANFRSKFQLLLTGILFFFCFFSPNQAVSQIKDEFCPDIKSPIQPKAIVNPTKQQRGYLKPAITGANQYFRVLFVFAEFEGNTYSSPSWPLNSLPAWANDLVDPVPDNYRPLTFSKFWDTMSMGQYDLIGDVYPNLVKVKSESYYETNGFNFTESNRDVFKALDQDPTVNWAKYDNWRYNSVTSAFEFQAGTADNYIDMIFVIYRDSKLLSDGKPGWFTKNGQGGNIGNFAGIAGLGTDTSNPVLLITGSGKKIDGNCSESGSGITIRTGIKYSSGFDFIELLAHELGHYLLGEHQFNSFTIMNYEPELRGCQLSSVEREYLGYISFTTIYQNPQTFPMTDVLTTGNALKITSTGSNLGEYIIIENHQRVSPFDQIDRGADGLNPNSTRGKGVYVFYIKNGDGLFEYTKVQLKNADGAYNWAKVGETTIGSVVVPLLDKVSVNRNSTFGDRNFDDFKPDIESKSGFAPFHTINTLTKQWELTWALNGDGKDAFNLGGVKIFTPWSNPSSVIPSLTPYFSFEIINQNAQAISLKTYISQSGSLSLQPSQPQLFKTVVENGSPRLTWTGNIEPDLNGYKIYKAITTGTEPVTWSLVAAVSKTVTTYFDESVTASTIVQSQKIFYRVTAVDNTLKESEASDYDWLYYDWRAQKISGSDGRELDLVTSFSIEKAYPNPFNPTTIVEFTLPEQGFVSYQVVDLQGRIVVDGKKQLYGYGHNQITVNGSNLASGVYLFRLSFLNQVKTEKLFLIK